MHLDSTFVRVLGTRAQPLRHMQHLATKPPPQALMWSNTSALATNAVRSSVFCTTLHPNLPLPHGVHSLFELPSGKALLQSYLSLILLPLVPSMTKFSLGPVSFPRQASPASSPHCCYSPGWQLFTCFGFFSFFYLFCFALF